MRLTLRTLLAWMDDTLPPAEVKEIGKQFSESSFARQLADRIRQVMRRRRLTVPSSTGPDATDPNLVASYLDNELDSDQVAEFEKLCLTSDVHLAEVASSHQILSMLRDKAKVPGEARYRMYRLVRGREALRPTDRRALAISESIAGSSTPPWAVSEAPRVSALERFGPPALAVGLIGALAWIGWLNLRNPGPQSPPVQVAQNEPTAVEAAQPPAEPEETEPAGGEEAPVGPESDVVPEPAEASAPDAAEAAAKEEAPPAEAPAAPGPDQAPVAVVGRVVGKLEKSDGLVLRTDDARRVWTRLAAEEKVESGQRLVHLRPLFATLSLGDVKVRLTGETEIVPRAPGKDEAARFDLVRGQVVLEAAGPAVDRPVAVGYGGQTLRIELPEKGAVGLDAIGQRPPGEKVGSMALYLFVSEGKVAVTTDPTQPSEAIQGPAFQVFDAGAKPGPVRSGVAPPWVTSAEPRPAQQKEGEAFLSVFGEATGAVELPFILLEGSGDSRTDVQGYSVAAMGATGNDELVMPFLKQPGAPALRNAALSVLQARLAEHPQGLEELRPLLARFTDSPEEAAEIEKLLIGFTEAELERQDLLAELVADLTSSNPSVRELAILHLTGITRRERLGYDPDRPEAGAREWQKLLRTGQLRRAAQVRPPAAPRNGP